VGSISGKVCETFNGIKDDADITLETLQDCKIVKLDHRKEKSGSYHEFIVITVEIIGAESKHNYTRVVTLQRTPIKDGGDSQSVGQRYNMKAKNGRLPAHDAIKVTPPVERKGSESVYTMTFPTHSPNILHLLCLTMAIISIAPEYRLYTYSCYWFARMIHEGLKYRFHGLEVPDPSYGKKRGAYQFSIVGMITALDSECRFILNTESKEEAKAKAQAAEEEPTLLYQAPTEPISADSEVFVTPSNTSSPSTSPSIPSAVAAMLKKYDVLLSETQEYIKAKRVSVTSYPEIIMSNFFGIACCNSSHNVNS